MPNHADCVSAALAIRRYVGLEVALWFRLRTWTHSISEPYQQLRSGSPRRPRSGRPIEAGLSFLLHLRLPPPLPPPPSLPPNIPEASHDKKQTETEGGFHNANLFSFLIFYATEARRKSRRCVRGLHCSQSCGTFAGLLSAPVQLDSLDVTQRPPTGRKQPSGVYYATSSGQALSSTQTCGMCRPCA